MDKPSSDVLRIVDECLEGKLLGHADAVRLCEIEAFTPDYYVLKYALRHLTYRASGGVAEVHGQIGMDANPCASGDCEFCSFAVMNNARPNEKHEMPLDRIIQYAKRYREAGANCLTLMITADYNWDQYLSYVEAVHAAVPDMPIMGNTGDFDEVMAGELKAAGAGSVYHAIRLGEGTVTRIPLETRVKTIEAAHAVGMKVATCNEMIRPGFTYEEVVNLLELSASLHCEAGFAGGIVPVPGTKMFDCERYSWARGDVFAAIYRMMVGSDTMPFGSGNLQWAEVGTNPRDDKNETEKDGLGSSVYKERLEFENKEWKVPEGPSTYW